MPDYSTYRRLKIDVADRVATVTFNRPEARNAIDHQFHVELKTIWPALMADDQVNAILLRAEGKQFSVGGNVKGMLESPAGDVLGEGETLEPEFGRRIVANLLDCEKPIVVALAGDCMGLAATVALFCDIVVMSETARIADPHVKVGLVAGDGGAVIWPLLIGVNKAKEFLMRGNVIDGREAERIGLVNYALPTDEVEAKAAALARELADGAPLAIRWTKLSVNKQVKEAFNAVMDTSFALEMATFQTEDHKEAVKSFIEKRKPEFKGR